MDDLWVTKVESMDSEVVLAIQRFCDIFDANHTQSDRMVILNIPHVVDVLYASDPIRSELLKSSYTLRPIKTRIIRFQECVETETESDSLYDVSFSTPGGSHRPKLTFPSSDEFSEEETPGDSTSKSLKQVSSPF